MGLRLSLDDLDVRSVVPLDAAGGVAEFLDGLARHDDAIESARAEAAAAGEVLRYVGAVEPAGTSHARLARFPADHPFARLRPTDNVVLFRTRRYHDNPLVVQGPGAGPEVTAGGVFADLLRLAAYLGAPS
jgi:aspartokinase/homoserine dehydrogenase 1